MVGERLICGEGTPESEWLAFSPLVTLPRLNVEALFPPASRLVICAPHPDDEILPCGGLLAAAHERGTAVIVLALTDGEGSHGDHPNLTPESLRRLRPMETQEALRRLEVVVETHRLGLRDGGLAEAEDLLSMEFSRRLRKGDIVIAPWRFDGHPDHEATARAALRAAARVGAHVWETPVWGWHWSRPADTPMPWCRGFRFVLNEGQARRKQQAIRAFESQLRDDEWTAPILAQSTLARFSRSWEVYFR